MGNEGSTGARPDAGFKDVALIHDLPRMVLIIEKWFERSIVRSTPRSSRHHCCRILLDGREVGRCASFPSTPMYIDPKRSNSTITVQLFANDCTFGVKDVEDVESIPPSSETSLDPEKTGVEETGLNDSIDLVASLDLNKGLCGELSFEVGRLVQYGAPLYTSLCLGLHPGNSQKSKEETLLRHSRQQQTPVSQGFASQSSSHLESTPKVAGLARALRQTLEEYWSRSSTFVAWVVTVLYQQNGKCRV